MPTPSDLKARVERELASIVAIRHDLHQHPELSFQESRTSGVVQRELGALGIEFKAGLGGGTGVVGYLPPSNGASEPGVALRADMDALPIEERTGLEYASRTKGVMHACGHDGHTAILIGAAKVLSKVERPRGVTLVFQPAEEGGGGADVMCREGALAGAKGGGVGTAPARIYGLHGWPQVELGTVVTRPGPLLAAVDDFDVTIVGRQAHGAYPHQGVDPIVCAAQVVTALQTIASRSVGPLDSVVVSVGAIHAGTANNIIPGEVRLIGTVRSLRAEVRALAKTRFVEIVEGTSRACGCGAKIDYHEGYPVTANDPEATERFLAIAREAIGPGAVGIAPEPTMGGEDFAYYGAHARACFFFLGVKPAGAAGYPNLHQPEYDFNDAAIPLGVELMTRLALEG
ncbi:MAG: amidohydrolase [Phycisphaerales bacterium]|nr:amidohydrolase [Phycisphaerales bacterium]